MNILFIGDIIGGPGRKIVKALLPALKNERSIDIVIANGENAAGGFGITEQVADELFSIGIDVITSGNHIFDKKDALNILNDTERLLRPANYPDDVPGKGVVVVDVGDVKVAVLNISGLVFMTPLNCPFKTIDAELEKLNEDIKIKIVDFHAEATSEKNCMGWYLDGRVSALLGTHTHIPTADERILPDGTGYITDTGMTGPFDSVIGVKKELAVKRFLLHMPIRFDTAKGDVRMCGVIVDIDEETGKCVNIERINIALD